MAGRDTIAPRHYEAKVKLKEAKSTLDTVTRDLSRICELLPKHLKLFTALRTSLLINFDRWDSE